MKKMTRFYSADQVDQRWHLIDAEGVVLGRLASRIASLLRGKHKPTYAPGSEVGDSVVVINAKKVRVTGEKRRRKVYYRHSGHVGHLKEIPLERALARKPEWVIEKAVQGMLPKNRLGRKIAKRLHVYAGGEHRHQAQSPQPMKV